jgi:hypothetical protein
MKGPVRERVSLPATSQQKIHVQESAHGKSARAALTKADVISGAPAGAANTGFPFSITKRAAVGELP